MPSSITRFNGVTDKLKKKQNRKPNCGILCFLFCLRFYNANACNRVRTQFTLNHKTFWIKSHRHWYGQWQKTKWIEINFDDGIGDMVPGKMVLPWFHSIPFLFAMDFVVVVPTSLLSFITVPKFISLGNIQIRNI